MVGTSCFNTDEIDKICAVLSITSNDQKADIFLATPSQLWETTNTTHQEEESKCMK